MDILIIRGTLVLLCAFFNLVLTIFLFTRRKENKAIIHLSLTALFSAVFCFTCAAHYFSWESLASYTNKLFWTRSTWLGVFILPAYMAFVWCFTSRKKYIILKSFLWYLTATAITLLALFTPYFTESIKIENSNVVTTAGKLEPLGRVYIILSIVVGLIYLLDEYFKSRGLKKLQLKYFILGIVIYSIGGIIFTGALPLIQKDAPYIDITALCSFFWVGLTSYAIVRYRLLDISVFLGKAVSFSFSLLTTLLTVLILVFILRQLPEPLTFSQFLPIVVIVFFGLFQLNKLYDKAAETYFYPAVFKKKMLISNLQEELHYLLEMEIFSGLIFGTFKKIFDLDKIAILVKDLKSGDFKAPKIFGYEEKDILSSLKNEYLVSFLVKLKKPAGISDIISVVKKTRSKEEIVNLKKIKTRLEKIEVEVIIPLLFERKIIGTIILGRKLSGSAFSREDMKVLENLSRQISIALRNTLLYTELKNRKDELERFYKLTVDRELKIMELQKKILELEEKLK